MSAVTGIAETLRDVLRRAACEAITPARRRDRGGRGPDRRGAVCRRALTGSPTSAKAN